MLLSLKKYTYLYDLDMNVHINSLCMENILLYFTWWLHHMTFLE